MVDILLFPNKSYGLGAPGAMFVSVLYAEGGRENPAALERKDKTAKRTTF
jgi:hypothetical protein